jgi:hypothetical protein
MVALPHMDTAALGAPAARAGHPGHAGHAGHAGGWQGIRQQLFGQKREREAQDQLLTVLTQLQTRLAVAIGVVNGPLRSPGARGQALRAIQDGLNSIIAWHASQLQTSRAIGWWNGPTPDLASEALRAAQRGQPLFEHARTTSSAACGTVDCADVIQGVAQLQGSESDLYFHQALAGMLAMLHAAYARISIDPPTAAAADAIEGTWEVLMDELRSLAPAIDEVEDPAEDILLFEATGRFEAIETCRIETPLPSGDPPPTPDAPPISRSAGARLLGQREAQGDVNAANIVVYPARFQRMELVAC